MKIYNDIEQGTTEWFDIRKMKMTGSHAQAIGSNGAGLKTYIMELMAESIAKVPEDRYINVDMEAGNNLEADARALYELETGFTVEQVGFIELDEYIGASPDGLVGDDGLIEIKCKNNKKHFEMILNGEKGIESKYIWQMQMQMWVCDKKWVDFVSFNANFEKSLVVHRIMRDEAMIEKLKIGAEAGKKMIKEINNKLNNI